MLTWLSTKIGLGLLSAALLICSLPKPDLGWLAWVALVPLFIACHGTGPTGAAGLGFVSGVAANFGTFGWLFEVPGFGWRHAFILAAYVAIYPTLWCSGVSLFSRLRSPLILSAPALWVALDYARAHAGFLALPWATLAQTQHDNLAVLQVASLTGEYGVTFLVALCNVALAEVILRRVWPNAVFAGLVIVVAHGWGAWELSHNDPPLSVRVVAVQPNILINERATENGRTASLERLERLTKDAAATQPVLIVWPESAIPGNLQSNPPMISRLQNFAQEIGLPVMLGVAEVEKFIVRDTDQQTRPLAYNSAYLILPGGPLTAPYRKRVLLPFGEYLPYAGVIPWPKWLAPEVFEMTAGEDIHLFKLSNGLAAGALICWENLFARLARESVQGGAQLLIQLTNDVWFGRTAASFQHNLASVLRAVENRVPVVIASNSGPSQIIDPYGRVVASVAQIFTEGIASGEVALGTGGTVYTRYGDLFVLVVISLLVVIAAWRVKFVTMRAD